MKSICLTITIAVFILICSNGIQAQTTQSTLNQVELMKQYLGTWQANVGKDTVEVWEFQYYGKAIIVNVNQVIQGQKTPLYINNIAFDSKEGNFKGFLLWPNGDYSTWIGSFTTEKMFNGNMVQNFNPETVYMKLENMFENPNAWTWNTFNAEGVKTGELKFIKVK